MESSFVQGNHRLCSRWQRKQLIDSLDLTGSYRLHQSFCIMILLLCPVSTDNTLRANIFKIVIKKG